MQCGQVWLLSLPLFLYIDCTTGAMRLNGATGVLSSTRGRIEVCNNNMWGTVCDDFAGVAEAVVACRQLGLSTTGMCSSDQINNPLVYAHLWGLDITACSNC